MKVRLKIELTERKKYRKKKKRNGKECFWNLHAGEMINETRMKSTLR